ncbi:hypothetical protein BS47DRAFT_1369075 [Hydnum rufescens UP504]|uniref:Uncharacterized protein n=1 Tax=Hydnum rufescens UP504 TaxID=1448309 RepID=A0A9P6AF57_9AGAM|nr:hypothetical protein BS47DRAFT_1369075 [Hydnum rufescens UP504]
MPTTTSQTKPKRAPHTRFCGCVVILSLSSDPTPATPPNEHGRTTTHLSNESRERQQVETTTQARTNPTPAEPGVVIFKEQQGLLLLPGILLNPHPPTKATTPPNENMQPRTVPHARPSEVCGLKPCGAYV